MSIDLQAPEAFLRVWWARRVGMAHSTVRTWHTARGYKPVAGGAPTLRWRIALAQSKIKWCQNIPRMPQRCTIATDMYGTRSTRTNTRTHTRHIHMQRRMHTCVHVHIYRRMHTCVHVHIYMCAWYIFTHSGWRC